MTNKPLHRWRVRSLRRWTLLGVLSLTLVPLTASAQTIPRIEAEETPLHWAAEHGLLTIAEALIENGAAVNAPDQFGRLPIHRAVSHPAMVALLLDAGADVNGADIFDRTPLHEALQYPESVVLLIDYGADITAEDFLGETPLERTLRYGTRRRNLMVIQLLISAGAGATGQ